MNEHDKAEPYCNDGGCNGETAGAANPRFLQRKGCGVLDGKPGRRQSLKVAGVGLVLALLLGGDSAAADGPSAPPSPDVRHFVPVNKRLPKEWVRALYEKGESRVYRDKALNHIGMPVGGIAAGQLYLCGDGTLGCWQIFNERYFSGSGKDNYRTSRMPARPIEQGFAVTIEHELGPRGRRLDRQDFPLVEFCGEYPIGRVRYADADFPVTIEMEAFSPFIPLNAKDSALPATVFHITVENVGEDYVRVGVLGWLENAIHFHSAGRYKLEGLRRSRVVGRKNRTLLEHTAAPPKPSDEPARPDVVVADFEDGTYGDWTVEGEAFGDKPASGTQENQQSVTGFQGERLVNSFLGGDEPQGKLTSPPFTIERRFITFLIGGGKHAGKMCINLLVDGEVARSATGEDRERLIWDSWDVREFSDKQARIEIVDRHSGSWGHINIDRIGMSDRQRFGRSGLMEDLEDAGSMVLALGEDAGPPGLTRLLIGYVDGLGNRISAEPKTIRPLSEGHATAITPPTFELPPFSRRTVTFVLAWHFPNREDGQMYANWFDSASDVAKYVLDHHDRLTANTRLWHDTYYDSTLPHWLLDRLHYSVSNLATGTCRWWKNGRFWAWEGVGSCAGTCTHVWNYAHALARLFPELERSVREMQDLDAALHEDGLVGFRGRKNNAYAADGQAGTVLKCYREHQMSAEDAFLKRNWPKIKQVLEYSIRQDADDDGLIEGTQHNTYDINFEGANTFVGSLYLAALRAGEEMANDVGDVEFAARLRRIFESGSRLSVERLWNGEYFIQDVDPDKHEKHQYGDGCLSDQLFGQGWAHQLGLGYLYEPVYVKKALESVWKYNWAPDVGPQNAVHKPERWFVSPGEAGLFVCTWPKSEHPAQGVRYRNEVWTGIEYQVAGNMIWEGLVEQALTIVRGVDDRYQPLRHNPFNEVECGDHYARALASWGMYTALCGYEHHGPKGMLGFAPRLSPEDFRAAFTTANGWGAFSQRRDGGKQHERIELRYGELRLKTLVFSVPKTIDRSRVVVRIGQTSVDVREISADSEDVQADRIILRLADDVNLKAGDVLEVVIG